MFDPSVKPRLFGLPPGADFPRALVAGLKARMAGKDPAAMARVTLFLNTAKMRERVRAAFQESGASFLPRLRLVSELGSDPLPGLPQAVPPLRRRLELAVLVGRLVERQKDFAPGTAVYDLADSLAGLMDEMQDEGVLPAAFEAPGLADDHAAHWERSLSFLRILTPWFEAGAEPDAPARQRAVTEALLAHWRAKAPVDPVLVAGSTGSRGTTALLMRAVACLPQGALVLPGFDFDMPDFGWNSLESTAIPDEDHPQYRYAALLGHLGLRSADIAEWTPRTAPDPARNRLVSLALRPAPVTDQWLREGQELLPLAAAANGLTLIEAQTPRQEALAVALALRAAHAEGRSATLIAPDRTLARRVTAALDRWGIRPDDSAGRPLHLTAPGRLLRHVAALFGRPLTAEALLVLLKHPLTATGAEGRGDHLRLTRDLELKLRRYGPPFPTPDDLRAWGAVGNDAGRGAWADWLAGWVSTLPMEAENSISAYTDTLLALTTALCAGPGGTETASGLWQEEAGRAARACLQSLQDEAPHGGRMSAAGFADLLGALLQKEAVREAEGTFRTICIRGSREAREVQADLVILAGLNEGIWPQPTAPDPWLSRQMRMKLGLLLPERQIGLAAHDFQQALAARQVILTRATRDDEAQTVPSRWLDRLINLMTGLEGEAGAVQAMRDRGREWLRLAAVLDHAPKGQAVGRPAPRPPVAARPRELPVTAIRTLIRDPYSIYARYVLRLRPLDPLLAEPDPRLRGQVLHRIVERFVQDRPADEGSEAARDRLLTTAEQILQTEIAWPSAQRLWLARIARFADRFVMAEADRAAAGQPVVMEEGGQIDLPGLAFRLTARPDRIDQMQDGSLHIYDYKSGKAPSVEQVKYFEKQLPLQAAMAERGAFERLGPMPVTGCTYVELGGKGLVRTMARDSLDPDAEWGRLIKLIGRYLTVGQGYAARRAVFKSDEVGDYDHLARFGEWQQSDPTAPEDVA